MVGQLFGHMSDLMYQTHGYFPKHICWLQIQWVGNVPFTRMSLLTLTYSPGIMNFSTQATLFSFADSQSA
jgi:hypothetical protein